MLYIKFKIGNPEKFIAFQKLYEHMVKVRQPDFKFEEEDEEELQFDWENMTEQEMDEAFDKINDPSNQKQPEVERYKTLIPNYANAFLEKYLQADNEKIGPLGILETLSILNYLEYGFEVDMNNLDQLNNNDGIVEFSTGNFPYGGMERFLMTLKAFDLIPTECFNGFEIYEFNWVSNFEHEAISLPEKTKEYLKR